MADSPAFLGILVKVSWSRLFIDLSSTDGSGLMLTSWCGAVPGYAWAYRIPRLTKSAEYE